jgi:hypothetical protein
VVEYARRVVGRYGRLDLLCLDELGYVQIDPRGAELLFQIITGREERASIAFATNLPFSKAHMFARTCARRRRNLTGSGPRRHSFGLGQRSSCSKPMGPRSLRVVHGPGDSIYLVSTQTGSTGLILGSTG